MRYALTGATGFVGSALARQLRAAGHDVRALVRDTPAAGMLEGRGVQLVPGDLDDRDALDRLCTDVDGLFHVAGWYRLGHRDPSPGVRATSRARGRSSRPPGGPRFPGWSTPAPSR